MDYRPIRGEFVALLQMQWDRETEQLLLLVQEPPKDHVPGKEWTLTVGVLRASSGREEFYRPRTSVEEAKVLKAGPGQTAGSIVHRSDVEVHSSHRQERTPEFKSTGPMIWCTRCERMIVNSNGPTATGVDPCDPDVCRLGVDCMCNRRHI